MMIIHILIFLLSCIYVNTRYSLYHSRIRQASYPTFDCLYAYLIDGGKETSSRYIRNYHLIPYCRRPNIDEKREQLTYTINENIAEAITFDELKKRGVTSKQLLTWYAPIDVAERYEMNSSGLDVFYNCSLPWFGSMCQYKFDYNTPLSFGDIVEATFSDHTKKNNVSSGTCYPFLNSCNREVWPLCIDWREICDGKVDCMSGEDEEWCDELEMTRCDDDDEYRCHYGGQCIPLTFAKDSRFSIDCLDGSDEIEIPDSYSMLMHPLCADISTFRCQERTSRYRWSFPCGDGQYRSNYPLPSRINLCWNKRDIEFSRAILTSLDYITDIKCREAFFCALHCNRTQDNGQPAPPDSVPLIPLVDKIWDEDCEPLSQQCSTECLVIPEHPTMFGFFQFVYLTNRSVDDFKESATPDFICFDAQKCPSLLANLVTIEIINGLTCCHTSHLIEYAEYMDFDQLLSAFPYIGWRCWATGTETSCANSSYFHCNQSLKCIPYHRVGDGMSDCSFFEDEEFDTCQLNDPNQFICESDPNKCLLPVAIGNGGTECPSGEDEVYTYTRNIVKLVPYPLLCNIKTDYDSFSLNSTETDETNCEWWPCNNPYTRCNNFWDCPNGADELNCPYSQCSFNQHECDNDLTGLSICIPQAHLFDKYIDNCSEPFNNREIYFYNGTENINDEYLSWNIDKCVNADEICRDSIYSSMSQPHSQICLYGHSRSEWMYTRLVHFFPNAEDFCYLKLPYGEHIFPPFLTAARFGYFPSLTTNVSLRSTPKQHKHETKLSLKIDPTLVSYCHRGIALIDVFNKTICLCPPNYFGSQCQWQNQRISLTVQFLWRSTASTSIIFQVIIMLIDENGEISTNSEQITYMPSRDCDTKFNLYLLYPHRPKNSFHKYSIRIDLFEKIQLNYWSSWYLSIPFSFLPVNRISTQLFIPESQQTKSCSLSCGEHGECTPYINEKSLYFCRCDKGYSGNRCEIKENCDCSSDSYCLSPSICVCPLYKYGFYCYLKDFICQSFHNPCEHNGLCIPNDDRIDLTSFTCFCPEDYSGTRCENRNSQINIHLDDKTRKTTSLVFIHFITAFKDAEHERITILKKIPFNRPTITFHISQPFNLVFLQIPNQHYYYLIIVREIFIPSENISTTIKSEEQRCLSIDQLMNNSLLNSEYLHRVKYYPFICRERKDLICFYDKDLMCICDIDRFSNCFLFNHTMNYDCQGKNNCENDGQCFQNNETCPTKSTCVCQDCYYGTKCQFSTKGFLFSLDPILAYHIKPNIAFNQQPLIIKISVAISTTMLTLGLISGILSILTFRRSKLRQVGSGNYLLISSIASLLMIIMLTIKFWQLILSQILSVTNRSLLVSNCISIDFVLKAMLASSEWLNACVAIERAMSVRRGFRFDRRKSKELSKRVIPIVFILTSLTQIHDPIHRQLIDDYDGDEKRIWCFVQYSSSVRIYNSFITLFHFLGPFSINLITALRMIQEIARRRSQVQPEDLYQDHLQRQLRRHQHLLIAPCLLILLSLPRLIISFMKGCMRSAREPWLYLIGYFVSFIPSMLTFIVFVLPSDSYKREFRLVYEGTIRRFRTIF